ncbi:MAG: PaaI family thioesterase [Bacteroidales bacterium]|jgi:acyl-coenzyme A thioesterase PaaI-like protein|nr:PaaI family thioesterase [Bacteroidales bacterium]
MRNIHNAYADIAEYHCFGCSPTNPIGLKLNFWEDGEWVFTRWTPDKWYEGYLNMLHGGIQATLLDEIANWVLVVKLGTAGVTKNLNITYLKPVFVNQGEITIRSKLISQEGNSALTYAELMDKEGTVRSHAEIDYFVYPPEIAKRKYKFPDYEDFFKK